MDERERISIPEELQSLTVKAYNLIPLYQLAGKGLSYPEGMRSKITHVHNRLDSEMKPALIKRFDDLVSKSSTTPQFRKMISLLFDDVCIGGRENIVNDHDDTLAEVLQIESPTGIYTREGAIEGERTLYEWSVKEFATNCEVRLMLGYEPVSQDPFVDILNTYSTEDFKDLLLAWHKEFTNLYKCPMDSLYD